MTSLRHLVRYFADVLEIKLLCWKHNWWWKKKLSYVDNCCRDIESSGCDNNTAIKP